MLHVNIFAPFFVVCALVAGAMASEVSPDVVKELAPTGRLRAAINYGNPVLAQKDPTTGEPRGVCVALARALARRLGTTVDFVTYETASKVFGALKDKAWDVAFLAVDPVRAKEISFTAPYVIIEGTYVVPADSPLHAIEDVDRAGVRIAVGRGSAFDLFLSRVLKHAQRVQTVTPAEAFDLFLQDRLEAAAGVKPALVAFAATHPGLRVIPGRFMAIEQAVATPMGRDAGARYLHVFVEEMKASGFVAKALAASGQAEVTVAPPGTSN